MQWKHSHFFLLDEPSAGHSTRIDLLFVVFPFEYEKMVQIHNNVGSYVYSTSIGQREQQNFALPLILSVYVCVSM